MVLSGQGNEKRLYAIYLTCVSAHSNLGALYCDAQDRVSTIYRNSDAIRKDIERRAFSIR